MALIRAGQDAPSTSAERGVHRWLTLARNRNVWGIVLGRALTDPIWWFYVFWLPQYLSDARGFSLQRIALFAWIPFIAADLGNFTGGWISGYCIRRGVSVLRARTWVCVVSCLPILAGIPAASVHSVYFALGLICFALWGYASWSTMGLTLPSDLFPQDVVATVTGISGLAGWAGGCGVHICCRHPGRSLFLCASVSSCRFDADSGNCVPVTAGSRSSQRFRSGCIEELIGMPR